MLWASDRRQARKKLNDQKRMKGKEPGGFFDSGESVTRKDIWAGSADLLLLFSHSAVPNAFSTHGL